MNSWLEERLPIAWVGQTLRGMRLAEGADWRHCLGMVAAFLFVQQCVVGTLLALYYSPSASDAWASTAYIQDRVAGGWVLRGLHHHGMSALVVVCGLHLVAIVTRRSYAGRREIVWLSGLGMGGLVLAFSMTGYTLTFDQNAYWATQVRTGIAATLPGGDLVNRLLLGGGEFGNLTLTRQFVLHAFVLPGAVLGLLVVHVLGFWRRQQVAAQEFPPPQALAVDERSYWSGQCFIDVVAMFVVTVILVYATIQTHGAPLGAPAEADSNFLARPEWFFLFLFELLHHFDGPTRFVGTVLIPGATLCFLASVPWLGRTRSRQRFVTLGCALILCGWASLTVMAIVKDQRNPELAETIAAQEEAAREARRWAKMGVLPPGGPVVFHNDPTYRVRTLYSEHCAKCHSLDPEAEPEAPVLRDYASRAWVAGLIRTPRAPQYYGATKHSDMEPYPESELPAADLEALVEYLVSLGRTDIRPASDGALVAKGAALFEEHSCDSCHEVEQHSSGDAPNLWGHGNLEWVEAMIRNPSDELLFGESAEMPSFADDLDKADIRRLAEFVVELRTGPPAPEGDATRP